jgi:hypothetical protein
MMIAVAKRIMHVRMKGQRLNTSWTYMYMATFYQHEAKRRPLTVPIRLINVQS